MSYLKLASSLIVLATLTIGICLTVKADLSSVNPYGEPTRIRCTVYTAPEGAITASGVKVHEGIIAGRSDWLGKVAVLYDDNMEFIGYYEFCDTGGTAGLNKGTVVAVFRSTEERCNEWIATYGDYVYIQIIDADG